MNSEFYICGFVILIAGSASILYKEPKVWSPYPLLVMLPAFFIRGMSIHYRGRYPLGAFVSSLFSAVPITVAYYIWSKGPVATSQIPLRSVILMVIVAVITILSFIFGWKYGVKYEGFMDTVGLAAINFSLATILVAILVLYKMSTSYVLSIAFHATLYFWMACFAMPLLGNFEGG